MLSARRFVRILTRYVACFQCPWSVEPTIGLYIIIFVVRRCTLTRLAFIPDVWVVSDSLDVSSIKTANDRADRYLDLLGFRWPLSLLWCGSFSPSNPHHMQIWRFWKKKPRKTCRVGPQTRRLQKYASNKNDNDRLLVLEYSLPY